MLNGKALSQLCLVIFLLLFAHFTYADLAGLGTETKPIRVGAINEAPFVIAKGSLVTGFAVDIFRHIAQQNNWHYQISVIGQDTSKAIHALSSGQFDLLIGPVSVTSTGTKEIDYGRPFFLAEIKMVFNTHAVSLLENFYSMFKSIPLLIFVLFFLSFFMIANIIWFAEHTSDDEMPKTYHKGVLFSLWVFIVHFLRGGLFYRPKTVGARVALVFWFIIALSFNLIVTSTFTAYLTAKVIDTRDPVRNPEDLKAKVIAYVQGEQYSKYIKNVDAIPVSYPNLKAALKALENKDIFGVIGGALILNDAIHAMNFHDLFISNFKFSSNEFAFAYPNNSPLRKIVDRALVDMRDQGEMALLCKVYFSEKMTNCEF